MNLEDEVKSGSPRFLGKECGHPIVLLVIGGR